MLTQLSCIVVEADGSNAQEMVDFLMGHGVQVVGHLTGVEQLTGHLGRSEPPQMVVMNLDPSPQEALRALAPLVRQHRQVSFFVLSRVLDPDLLMDAMQVGVAHFVPLPIDEGRFVAGIERVAQAHGMGKRARIIQVIPSAGGCGATTVACNLAAMLAKGGKTALVDLDLTRGAVAASFDVRPRFTIADVMDSAERLDSHLLDNALTMHEGSGLAILARPDRLEETGRVTQAGFSRLLNVLGRAFDYVVIDSVMSMDPLYTTAIEAADLNVVVMQLNVVSARNTERFVGALRRTAIDLGKLKVIVNRFAKRGRDLEPEKIERALGLKISWMIPNDFRNAIDAMNYGEPVVLRAPKAEVSASLRNLAQALNGRGGK